MITNGIREALFDLSNHSFNFLLNGVLLIFFFLFPQTTGNIHNFCEVGLKIAGIVPIYSPPAITYSNSLLTSLAVSVTEQHTVAFLGNSNGHLKKVMCVYVHTIIISYRFDIRETKEWEMIERSFTRRAKKWR